MSQHKYDVYFVKCTKAVGGLKVTVGKNYVVVFWRGHDYYIVDDDEKMAVAKSFIGLDTIGLLKLNSFKAPEDPALKDVLLHAKDDFCTAMHVYYL